MSRFTDFFRGIFKKDFMDTPVDFASYRSSVSEDETYVAIQAHALFTVIDLIATLLSKCDFKVYKNGEEYRKQMYDILNFQPNRNQNAVEFKKEIFTKLLYRKEVLVVQKKDQLLIADTYNCEERVLKDYLFTEVSRQDFTFNNAFSMRDVIFLKYGNVNIDKFMDNIFDFYTKLMATAAKKYMRSAEEKGILKVSARAQGDPSYEDTFKELMNEYFKEYFGKGNSVLPLFEGYEYAPGTAESTKKYSNEITDVCTIFEQALIRAAQAYKVPPSLVRGDVASINDAYNVMLTNCIDPIAELVSRELTIKLFSQEERIKGCSIEVDTTSVKHTDLFDIASGADKLIASGATSINEVRHHAGLKEIDEEFADIHYITKNYQTADMAANGEEDSNNANNSNSVQGGSQTGTDSGSGSSEEEP